MLAFFVTISLNAYAFAAGADTPLLDTSGGVTAYIDTESQEYLSSLCSGDTTSLSLWEAYQCEFLAPRDGWKKCWPQRRLSSCTPGQAKGVFFLYHGFSACPDAYNTLADRMQADCWHVYQISTIGHGFNYCGSSYDNSTKDQPCTAGKYNESTLPESAEAYVEFVQRMYGVIENEVGILQAGEQAASSAFDADAFEVAVGGLSFGAPLATGTVVLAGADSVFTRLVNMSPFFGIAYKGLDDLLYKCLANAADWTECLPSFFSHTPYDISEQQAQALSVMVEQSVGYFVNAAKLDSSFSTFNLLLRKLITWSVEKPELITDATKLEYVNNALNSVIGWGWKCEMDEKSLADGGLNRGGFCKFAVRKIAAAHSFAQFVSQEYVRSNPMKTSMKILTIAVERDGKTGAALGNNFVRWFYKEKKAQVYAQSKECMWLISEECQSKDYNGTTDDNRCGVPHAWIAEKDNLLIPPYEMYWEDTALQGVMAWLNGVDDNSADNPDFLVNTNWDSTSNQCVYVDPVKPPRALVADNPSVVSITTNFLSMNSARRLQAQEWVGAVSDVLDAVTNLTGAARGVLELSNAMTTTITSDDTMEFLVDADSANLLQALMDHEALSDIAGYEISNLSVRGEEYEPSTFAVVNTDGSGGENTSNEKVTGWIWIAAILIGVVVGALLVCLMVCGLMKCKGYKLVPAEQGNDYGLMKGQEL